MSDASSPEPRREAPTVRAEELRISFGDFEAVRGVSFDVRRSECLALVGESGSGKSVTARALLGLSGDGARVEARTLSLGGGDLPLASGDGDWRSIRGGRIGLVHQDALVALDPLRPVWREVDDALRLHTDLGHEARRRRVLELLERAGLEDPGSIARRRSGQLSGGQRQRVLIAAALAGEPELLIADEPTSSVDQAVQAQLIELFSALKADGMTMLFITHDLGVVQRLADRVAVMSEGLIVETAPTARLFAAPEHRVTRQLLAAQPKAALDSLTATPEVDAPGPLLEVRGVSKTFRGAGSAPIQAVREASFTLSRGETLGIVGSSGSGKSTLARIALGLERPDAGTVSFLGDAWSPAPERLRRARRAKLGSVPQDALSSFDPRRTVGEILADALTAGRSTSVRTRRDAIDAALERVGLDGSIAGLRPLHLSGGQRQRLAIARALAPEPEVLLCDEPVSSLDVTVQAQVLALLERLVDELGLACVFISHDLAVVAQLADRVAVMSDGEIVETASVSELFSTPKHPASRALLDAHKSLEVR
ncbi:nickel ABC transporter ATP-binding protein NikE [Pseudoclavibacter sp. 8L]|uniref:nickel ABC transporter ATP-binding protein NikE n=1 Tax=Pseudoclavibacter sp. 8L TaxID=2653162 RepID=UPI0012F288F2|nr:ABC transporter ATP-binding protein [Pseudoclavibacter sp. 8L]VXA94931.1 ABC transporter ATP-binding protein [Pseudoclavibacter sp. 8L]